MKKRSKRQAGFFQKPERNYENVWETAYATAYALKVQEYGFAANRGIHLYASEVANHAYAQLKAEDARDTKQLNELRESNVRRAARIRARTKKG